MTPSDFAAIYDAHVGIVRSVLMRVGAYGHLDDLTQEVFLRAWRSRDSFRGQASAKTWLCRIARNLAIDLRRSAAERKQVGAELGSAILEEKADGAILPDARALLKDALAQMLPDDRLLLLLLSVEECTMSEISEVLEIPVGTVKSRAFSLRQRLREQMEQKGAA